MEMIKSLPASDYHKIKALSASTAKTLLKSPAHYLASLANPREPTAAMRLGTLCHTLVFEPDDFEKDFAIMPKVDSGIATGSGTGSCQMAGSTVSVGGGLDSSEKMMVSMAMLPVRERSTSSK